MEWINGGKETLTNVGYIVSGISSFVYLVWIFSHDTVKGKYTDPRVSAAFKVLVLVNFTLLISAVILTLGIIKRNVIYLKSWLTTVAISVLVGTLSLMKCAGHGDIVVPSVILILTGLAWIPMYALYRIYRSEQQQQPSGIRCLESAEILATAPPIYAGQGVDNSPDYSLNPPSYDTVVESIGKYPIANTTAAPPVVWRN